MKETALLRKFFGQQQPKEGLLGKFDLLDWWNDSFTDEERGYIISKYRPTDMPISDGSILTHGSTSISSAREFLSNMASWFNNPSDISIAIRMMNKAQELPSANMSLNSLHFDCQSRIEFFYRWRDEFPEALELAILACKEQISIAGDAAKMFADPRLGGFIPRHVGYQQLAIIYEKRGQFQAAIEICELGQAQGWNNDFEKRLNRLRKKLAKQ